MTITFSFAAPTGHDIDIEWYHNDVLVVDGTFDGVVVSGATTEVLTITNPTSAWNGVYFARVIDHTADCTVDSEPRSVTVPATCDLAITVQPVDVNTSAGNDIELSVAYTGAHGTVTFQWYKDGLELEDGAQAIGTVSGALTDTLTIEGATVTAAGNYTVILVDDGIADCSVESDAGVVVVAADCDLLITSQPESQQVVEDEDLELTFAYTGTGGPFTIQWFLDDVPLVDGASGSSTISGATTDTLTITDWTDTLAGAYYAVVTDTATVGCVAQTATAVVTAAINTVQLNGTDNYLERQVNLNGLANGKTFTFAMWVKFENDGIAQTLLQFNLEFPSFVAFLHITRQNTNKIRVLARRSLGSFVVLDAETSETIMNADGWCHIYICVDLSNPANRHIYINGTEDMGVAWSTYDNFDMLRVIPATNIVWGIGAQPPADILNGALAELWYDGGYFNDPTKFISGGCPVDLGATGQLPTGTPPVLYLSKNGSAENWRIDSSGNNNDFDVIGTVTNSGVPLC